MLTTAIVSAVLATAPATPVKTEVSRIKTFNHLRVVALAAHPTSSLFAASLEDGSIKIMDAAKLTSTQTLVGHPQPCYGLAFSKDGKYLASGDDTARIYLWDVKTGKKIREYPRDKGHKRGIQSISFTRDSKRFASVGKDDVIKVWNTSGGHPKNTILGKGANFYGAGFLPSGALAAGTLKDGLRLYEPKAFALAQIIDVPGPLGLNDIDVNSRGTLATAAGRDGKLYVFDLKGKKLLNGLASHNDWAIFTCLAPNGRLAASSSSDRTVKMWDVKSLQPVVTLQNMSVIGAPMAFTGNGKFFISSSSADTIQVYSVTPAAK